MMGSDWLEIILFFLFALVCEVLGTLGGFGSSMLFVPIGGFFFPRPLLLGMTSVLHVFSNTSKVILFFKTIEKRLLMLFGIPALLLTIAGALMVEYISTDMAEWIMAILLLLFSCIMFYAPKLRLPATGWMAISAGALSGFSAGLIGTGGAIRGLALAAFDLEKNLFVGTSAAIDFGVDMSRMLVYTESGFLHDFKIWYFAALALASWMGTWLGKYLLLRINQENFRRIVLLMVFLTGLAILIKRLGFSG